MVTKYLELNTTARQTVTRHATEPEWDRDDTHTDWTVRGVHLRDQDGYDRVGVPFDVDVGDEVFVVYAIYSTGDSFGHDSAANLEFIDVFKTRELAGACVKALSAPEATGVDWKKQYESWTATYKREDGTEAKYHRPWMGYFESLDDLTVESFTVQL